MPEIYEKTLDNSGDFKPSGMKFNSSLGLTDVGTERYVPNVRRAQQQQSNQNVNTPIVQPLEDVADSIQYGQSRYDEQIINTEQLKDIEDTRAKLQPWLDKLGAGLATFGAKTITATVGGTVGMVNGLYQSIADGKFSSLYNNDFNKNLNTINEGIDDTFKVHFSDAERNGSFFDQSIGS